MQPNNVSDRITEVPLNISLLAYVFLHLVQSVHSLALKEGAEQRSAGVWVG